VARTDVTGPSASRSTRYTDDHAESPPEPGFARWEAHLDRKPQKNAPFRRLLKREPSEAARKEGAHGGTRGSPVQFETVSSEAGFTALAGSWDDLVRAMPRPSPFLLHTWLQEWWRHYGDGATLAVHVAFRGDRLIGALPLCVRRRYGLRVSEFLGGTGAALADLLVAPGEDAAAVPGLVDRAADSAQDFANLFGLPGSSRLVAALPPGALRLVERLEAPVLDLSPGWDAVYSAKTTSKLRGDRRRRMRKLEALGTLEVAVARTRDELAPALEDAFRIHALRWQGRRDGSDFVTPTGMRFYRAAVLRLVEDDVPRILTLRLDGRAIAFAISLQLSRRAYGVTMAFDPEFARFGPGSEALLHRLETAAGEGMERFELLGAAAFYKQRFTDWLDPIYQGIGLAGTLRGRAAAAALLAGIRVRRRLKRSETARKLYYRVPRLKRR
jgi:CelD/BcsL family acetyltransferase involved in cellulose biosynthesis